MSRGLSISEIVQGGMAVAILSCSQHAVPREKEERQVKKISIRKAGAVKLTGAMRPLYGTVCVA
jgi:hypothetical protein